MALSGNLVMVSLNYRLGAFGFMRHPAFDRDYDGSYGVEDQREALRGVQRTFLYAGETRKGFCWRQPLRLREAT